MQNFIFYLEQNRFNIIISLAVLHLILLYHYESCTGLTTDFITNEQVLKLCNNSKMILRRHQSINQLLVCQWQEFTFSVIFLDKMSLLLSFILQTTVSGWSLLNALHFMTVRRNLYMSPNRKKVFTWIIHTLWKILLVENKKKSSIYFHIK